MALSLESPNNLTEDSENSKSMISEINFSDLICFDFKTFCFDFFVKSAKMSD